ncbi:MAG: hypothetical protein U5J98_01800 [Halobacteriales archaeon]|nr:hypothetical protein [Halobacteriales archaeon]
MTDPRIAAVGTSPLGRTDLTGRDLFSVAVAEAFEGLPDPAEVVDALYVGNQSESYEHQIMYGTLMAEWCGLRHVPAERVEGCAAAGALALRHAVEDVRSGRHDAVLACGVEKMTAGGTAGRDRRPVGGVRPRDRAALRRHRPQPVRPARPALPPRDRGDRARPRAHRGQEPRERRRQPRAMFQRETDVESVLDSDYVAPPLKLFDCAPVTDGAAVVLVANDDVTASLPVDDSGPGRRASAPAANNLAVADRNLTFVEGAHEVATQAYDEAGIDAGRRRHRRGPRRLHRLRGAPRRGRRPRPRGNGLREPRSARRALVGVDRRRS